jgi:imidazoleglycerol-phosphate dehydratase/histidinol-phosphatase
MRDGTVDLASSAVIGDRDTDLQFATNLGVRGIRVRRHGTTEETWPEIVRALTARRARVERRTKETNIEVSVDLDATAPNQIATGIGFFDHMLEQLAKHGGFALQLTCKGDLQIDEHHTVEDCALALGEALRRALGSKVGIARYGFLLPMDEAQAQVAIDLSGRAFSQFSGRFTREAVGGLPTELVPHFFRSLAESLGAAVHVSVTGENAHHMIEGCFKGVGRALRQAFRRESEELPSTKGVL